MCNYVIFIPYLNASAAASEFDSLFCHSNDIIDISARGPESAPSQLLTRRCFYNSYQRHGMEVPFAHMSQNSCRLEHIVVANFFTALHV